MVSKSILVSFADVISLCFCYCCWDQYTNTHTYQIRFNIYVYERHKCKFFPTCFLVFFALCCCYYCNSFDFLLFFSSSFLPYEINLCAVEAFTIHIYTIHTCETQTAFDAACNILVIRSFCRLDYSTVVVSSLPLRKILAFSITMHTDEHVLYLLSFLLSRSLSLSI